MWVAVLDDTGLGLDNPPTRAQAMALLAEIVDDGARCLVGVDVSFGFPAGAAEAFGWDGESAWSATWGALAERISDDERNRNNRFAVAAALNAAAGEGPGPFWGCPAAQAGASLTATRPPAAPCGLPTWRLVEQRLREAGQRPFSAWQLLGAGSVGSQSLVGIAALERFRRDQGSRGRVVDVWPFGTGLGPPSPDCRVVLAEVWPSLWPVEVQPGEVKDAAQVRSTAMRLQAADADGELASWFAPRLDDVERAVVVAEEGWVLGVPGCSGVGE